MAVTFLSRPSLYQYGRQRRDPVKLPSKAARGGERQPGGHLPAAIPAACESAGAHIGLYFAGPRDFVLMYASQMAGSFFTGPLFPLIWAMYADTADYGEWRFGRRATGLIFS